MTDPILDCFERYSGQFVDLDAGYAATGDQLRRWRCLVQAGLTRSGMGAGDRVVFRVANGPLFPAALAAVLGLGAAPILTHAGTGNLETGRIAAAWKASWMLSDTGIQGDAAEVWSSDVTESGTALHLARAAGPGERGIAGVPLHPTSGTTGLPKLALRPGASAIAEADHYAAAMDIGPGDRILCTTPMSHAYAYGMALMVPLLTGADALCLRTFEPRKIGHSVAQDGVTILPLVPAMLPVVLRGGWRTAPLLRLLLVAGAPLPPDIAKAFTDGTEIRPRPLFGTTETGGISVATGDSPVGVGRPMAGVEIRLQETVGAADDARPLEVRSASMMSGYLSPANVVHGVDPGGWFATGDLARLTPNGDLELLGRKADVINVMGHKVLPTEIEEIIGGMPHVAEVKVYAGCRVDGGEFVAAAIVASGHVSADAVMGHCIAQLVSHKVPSQVHVLKAMPRNPSGKVVVAELPNARSRAGRT